MSAWLKALRDITYPPECLLCGSGTGLRPGFDACYGCLAELPRLEHACERCAESLVNAPGSAVLCGTCLSRPPPFSRTFCLGQYAGGLAALVRGLKFQGRLENGRLLGCLLGRYLAAHARTRPVLLAPVPLHRSRLRKRGFNQAAEIARWAARESGCKTLVGSVLRQRRTAAQTGLSAAARRANLRGAFACTAQLGGKDVAIIDDVMTTGSTAASMAQTLLDAGSARIELWCCARASM